MANGMTCIMYPFVNNMELLIDYPYSDTTFRKDIVKCIDHIAKIAEQAGVNDIRPDNIFYTQDDNILRLRIFDTQYYHTQEPKDIHTNWDHTPRPLNRLVTPTHNYHDRWQTTFICISPDVSRNYIIWDIRTTQQAKMKLCWHVWHWTRNLWYSCWYR